MIFWNWVEIFNKIYAPGNIGQIRTLKDILVKNPEVYKKFQRDVLTDLNERVFKTDKKYTLGKVLDADAFNRYLNTDHNIVIIKGKELITENKKNIKIEEEHPLLMSTIEKFDGKIIK